MFSPWFLWTWRGEGIYPFIKCLISDVLDEIEVLSLIISSDVCKITYQIFNLITLIKKNSPSLIDSSSSSYFLLQRQVV